MTDGGIGIALKYLGGVRAPLASEDGYVALGDPNGLVLRYTAPSAWIASLLTMAMLRSLDDGTGDTVNLDTGSGWVEVFSWKIDDRLTAGQIEDFRLKVAIKTPTSKELVALTGTFANLSGDPYLTNEDDQTGSASAVTWAKTLIRSGITVNFSLALSGTTLTLTCQEDATHELGVQVKAYFGAAL